MFLKGLCDAALNFLFWWHKQVLCLTGKQNSPTECHRKCASCQFIVRARQKEAVNVTVFPNLGFACMVGRIFSSFSILILLDPTQSNLDNPAIYSFGKSPSCIPLALPFSPKWWLENLRWWDQNAKHPKKCLFWFVCTVHWLSSSSLYGLRTGHTMLAALASNSAFCKAFCCPL